MFADEFKHEVGGYLKREAEVLLESRLRLHLQTMASVPEDFPMRSQALLLSRT